MIPCKPLERGLEQGKSEKKCSAGWAERFNSSIDAGRKWVAGFVFPSCPAHEIAEEPISPRETDSYGEWVIRKLEQEAGGYGNPLPAQAINAARVIWPRVATLVTIELKREGSGRESEALAADIWEGVLRSVAKALQRKGDSGPTIKDFELYLLAAFHHRFHRFLKVEHGRARKISVLFGEP
jgi:hypothetical protein